MNFDSFERHRRSIRLPGYDYNMPGAYFVTICTHKHETIFGNVVAGELRFNAFGNVALNTWNEIPDHFDCIQLGEFCVMPNHIHGVVIIIDRRGKACLAPTAMTNYDKNQYKKPQPGSLGVIVGSYKSAVTCRINNIRGTSGLSVWQRNYYEHIIRNENELSMISEYIAANPMNWECDELHAGNK